MDRALVVASEDGLDEISIGAATKVVEVNGEEITRYTLAPGDVGIELAPGPAFERDCGGGSPQENAAVTRAILNGGGPNAERPASTDLAAINAGAAIYAAGRADTIAAGVEAARAALADGSAAARWSATCRPAAPTRRRRQPGEHAHADGAGADPAEHARGARAAQAGAAAEGARGSRPERGWRPRRAGAALLRRADAARDRGDRRVQAPLALGRDAARGRGRGRGGERVSSAAAQARCRC